MQDFLFFFVSFQLSDLSCETYRYKVGCDLPGKYSVALDSDAWEFGGHGRVRNPLYNLCMPPVIARVIEDKRNALGAINIIGSWFDVVN